MQHKRVLQDGLFSAYISGAYGQAAEANHRAEQRDTALELMSIYNPGAVVCAGVPFGHTRPQWILPYGGHVTIDGATHAITADYA